VNPTILDRQFAAAAYSAMSKYQRYFDRHESNQLRYTPACARRADFNHDDQRYNCFNSGGLQ